MPRPSVGVAIDAPSLSQLAPEAGWRAREVPRMLPLDPRKAGLVARLLVTLVNRVGKLEASNLFLTLLNNLRLFRVWVRFAAKLMPHGEIERRDTELVILRVAWNCRCRYEWGQHVDIGMRAGVTTADIARVAIGPAAAGWSDRERGLLQACDEIHRDRVIGDATWDILASVYDQRRLIEVMMLIGHYEMLAGLLNSTSIPLDARLERLLGTLRAE